MIVSKLFRAYRLYNVIGSDALLTMGIKFQSSFELTGYITNPEHMDMLRDAFQSSFELTGYITHEKETCSQHQ